MSNLLKPHHTTITDSHFAIFRKWEDYLNQKSFPCVAAKTSLFKDQMKIMVAGHIACPKDDLDILKFLYDFVDRYRASDNLFHSAVVLFEMPETINEDMYAMFFWQRLQALADLDAPHHGYDRRVNPDPESENFSFSIKGEAFFIIGLHPGSSRPARQFAHPAIVFNPHAQFEKLREANQYQKMKNIIRKRDVAYSGSVNPMLEDFGQASEVYQYTGQKLSNEWKCPLNISHRNANY